MTRNWSGIAPRAPQSIEKIQARPFRRPCRLNRIEIFVRHDAELDASGYFQYIRENNPEAALRFLKAIDGTGENWRRTR